MVARLKSLIPIDYCNELIDKVADEAHRFYFPVPGLHEPNQNLGAAQSDDHAPKDNLFTLPRLVLMHRTGLTVGSIIARKWGIQGVDVLTMAIDRDEDGEFVVHGQLPSPELVDGQSLLLIDGVTKSGEKLQHGVELLELAGAALVKTAVMINKPKQNTPGGVVPDFVGDVFTDGAFLILPWEKSEFVDHDHAPRLPGSL